MNGTTKKVSLETLYNALFTIGLLILFIGVGQSDQTLAGFEEGALTIVMGVILIAVGGFIYYLKVKLPQSGGPTAAVINDIKPPEQLGLPVVEPAPRDETQEGE